MAKKKSPKRNRPNKPASKSDAQGQASMVANAPSETATTKRQWWRVGISILIVLHLMSVALPPLAMQANGEFGRSPSVNALLGLVSRYGEFTYLDRGYAFFAPDPGPSHLIQALVTQPSGEKAEVIFPDREQQWPRLNYHRHFMITEFLSEVYEVPAPPRELFDDPDPVVRQEAREWARRRARYEIVRQSIADHLKPDGGEALIGRRERVIPSFVEYLRDGFAINDPRYLTVLRDVPVIGPIGPPESVPPPEAVKVEAELKKPVSEPESETVGAESKTQAQDDDAKTNEDENATDPKGLAPKETEPTEAEQEKPEPMEADEPAPEESAPEESAPEESAPEEPETEEPKQTKSDAKEPEPEKVERVEKEEPEQEEPAQEQPEEDSSSEAGQ